MSEPIVERTKEPVGNYELIADNTSDPIVEVTREHVGYFKTVERSHTYKELLDIFGDEGNVVNPLVKRCQRYEAEIQQLRAENERLRAERLKLVAFWEWSRELDKLQFEADMKKAEFPFD